MDRLEVLYRGPAWHESHRGVGFCSVAIGDGQGDGRGFADHHRRALGGRTALPCPAVGNDASISVG